MLASAPSDRLRRIGATKHPGTPDCASRIPKKLPFRTGIPAVRDASEPDAGCPGVSAVRRGRWRGRTTQRTGIACEAAWSFGVPEASIARTPSALATGWFWESLRFATIDDGTTSNPTMARSMPSR